MQEKYKQHKKILQKAIAEIVREYRLKRNKSISLISAEIGMTKSMWRDLECQKKDPQFTTIWRIAEALEVPLSSIVLEIEKHLGKDFSLIDFN